MGRLCLFIVQKLDNMNFIHTFEDENIYKSIIGTMKNIYRILAAAVAAMIAFAGCTKPAGDETGDDEQNVTLNENIVFTIELGEVTANTARITVSHDGVREDTWYGFVTSETDVNAAVLAEIDRLLSEEGKVKVNKSTRKTTTLQGLDPATEYTYVVVGITEAGKLYGEPKSLEFTTAKGEVKFTENSAWTVEYTGADTINGTEYEHTANVTSTDDNMYLVTAYPVEVYEQEGIKKIAEYELAYLKKYIEDYNKQNGTDFTIEAALHKGNGIEALPMDVSYGTEWYAMAIGVGTDGELSGLWAKSAVITLEEEAATEEYAAWIGDWTFTGANDASFNVTFRKGMNNYYYYMSGWEGDETTGLEVRVDWMADSNLWVIFAQTLGIYDFGTAGEGEVLFVPLDAEGYYYYDEESAIPACIGGVGEDGSRVVVGYSEEMEDGSVFGFSTMRFIAIFSDGAYALSETEVFPTFPLTVTKVAEASMKSSVIGERRRAQVYTNIPRTVKTYYQLNCIAK